MTPSFSAVSDANHSLLRLLVATLSLTEDLASNTPEVHGKSTSAVWQASKNDEMPKRIRSEAFTLLRAVVDTSHGLTNDIELDIALDVRL